VKTRDLLRQFEPYEWEKSNEEIASLVGLKSSDIVRLDANTSPYLPKWALEQLSQELLTLPVNSYPDTSYTELRKRLVSYTGSRINNFVITNGADEALDITAKTFIDPGDEVIVTSPTYSMFRIVSQLLGGRIVEVWREKIGAVNYAINVENIVNKISGRTKIIFLCNPNNPTGNFTPVDQVISLLERCKDTAVVVDEAYYEFCGKTLVDLTRKFENLVLIRTFSKAFSMAGVRVGYVIANESTVLELNKVRPPNSLSVISLHLAQFALEEKRDDLNQRVSEIVTERKRCEELLSKFKELEVFPSEANFILFKVKGMDAGVLHKRLVKKGYVLRDFSSSQGIENCLRVTISLPEINNAFVEALSKSLSQA